MAKFLVVDDSPMERFTLKTCIEKLGHEVIAEAKNGVEALAMYKKLRPDVVMLDIIMPNDSGIDVLKQLMDYDKDAKVIMCTSAATENAVINTVKLGAIYFLAKPLEMDSLSKVIETALEN